MDQNVGGRGKKTDPENRVSFDSFAKDNFKIGKDYAGRALAIANYSPELLVGQLYNQRKKAVTNPEGRNQHAQVKGKICTQPTTAEQVAAETGVSPRTVKRAGRPVRCVDSAAEHDLS